MEIKPKPPKTIPPPLARCRRAEVPYEIGIDECGRGPLFGRVYAAAVALPRDLAAFDHTRMKDSKKIKSKKKMAELAAYIREHSLVYSIQYVEADVVDRVNILQADMQAMHACVKDVLEKHPEEPIESFHLLVDGNYFKPVGMFDGSAMRYVSHETVEQGDNHYASIAAASILAKHARDSYIESLCETYPELVTRYGMNTHMGYGTARHLEGIRTHGITQWHRRSFGLCKTAEVMPIGGTPGSPLPPPSPRAV